MSPLPKTIVIPSLKLGAKKLLPRKKTALKDFNWLQLKSNYIKRFLVDELVIFVVLVALVVLVVGFSMLIALPFPP